MEYGETLAEKAEQAIESASADALVIADAILAGCQAIAEAIGAKSG